MNKEKKKELKKLLQEYAEELVGRKYTFCGVPVNDGTTSFLAEAAIAVMGSLDILEVGNDNE